jgi:hypothetical protein
MKALRYFLALSLIVMGASVGLAHEPPGEVYFTVGFPGHAVPVSDGDLSDWDMVPEEFWLTLENDFEETVRGIGTDFDLADFNIKCIVGWSEDTNRIYTMAAVVDDYLHNKRENTAMYNYDDELHFVVDADHGGGDMFGDGWFDLEPEEYRQLFYTEGQLYNCLIPPLDGYWTFMYIEATGWWLNTGKEFPYPEYLAMGWTRTGENEGPGSYTYEMMVTPWDWLDWSGPEASIELDLEEGLIIHIGFLYKDYDTDEAYEGSYDFPPIHNVWRNANLMGDMELLAADPEMFPTAVETDSWGRIKASMLVE